MWKNVPGPLSVRMRGNGGAMNAAISNLPAPNMNSDQIQIEHSETPVHGEFTIGRDAIMTYRKVGDRHIEVNHTRVAREAQGRGLAGKLYRAVVEYARSQGLKVTPTCSYVVKMFERFPEDRDLLDEGQSAG